MAEPSILVLSERPFISFALQQLLGEEGLTVTAVDSWRTDPPVVVARHRPRLIVVDLFQGELEGPMFLRQIKAFSQAPAVLVLAEPAYALYLQRFAPMGADGYISLRSGRESIVRAVRMLLDGRPFQDLGESHAVRRLEELTDRELEVFFLMGEGYRPRQIADLLDLSVRTVNRHRENIQKKLRTADMAELDLMAVSLVHGNPIG